jgi:hypothetical protein
MGFFTKTKGPARTEPDLSDVPSLESDPRFAEYHAATLSLEARLKEAEAALEALLDRRRANRASRVGHARLAAVGSGIATTQELDRVIADEMGSGADADRLDPEIKRATELVVLLTRLASHRERGWLPLRSIVRAERHPEVAAAVLRRCDEAAPLLQQLAPIAAELVAIGAEWGGAFGNNWPGLPARVGGPNHIQDWLKTVAALRRDVEA